MSVHTQQQRVQSSSSHSREFRVLHSSREFREKKTAKRRPILI
jgi:hypothetical protein